MDNYRDDAQDERIDRLARGVFYLCLAVIGCVLSQAAVTIPMLVRAFSQ